MKAVYAIYDKREETVLVDTGDFPVLFDSAALADEWIGANYVYSVAMGMTHVWLQFAKRK